MTAELTREDIDRWRIEHRSRVLPPAAWRRLFAAAEAHLDEPARLAAARAEGVREGIEMAVKLIDEQYPLTNHVVGGRVSISRAIRALAPPPAEAPTPTVEASNGWIEWKGGECPVEPDAVVEVRMRDGRTATFDDGAVDEFWWGNDGCSVDILAYRIVKPAEPSAPVAPEFDDEDMAAVGRSLMEAIHDNRNHGRLMHWMPADGPAEIVVDMLNWLDDSDARIAALEAESKALRERGALVVQALDGPGANAQLLVSAVDGLRALLQGQEVTP